MCDERPSDDQITPTSEHPFPTRQLVLGVGMILVSVGVAAAASWWAWSSRTEDPWLGVVLSGFAALFWVAAWWLAASIPPTLARHPVLLSSYGMRFGKIGGWVPWSRVRDTRVRPWLQRLDVLDERGGLLGWVDRAALGYERVLRTVLDRIAENETDEQPLTRRFGHSRWRFLTVYAAMMGGLWLLLHLTVTPEDSRWWLTLLVLAAGAWGLLFVGRGEALQLDLAEDELVLTYLTTRRRIPREDIFMVSCGGAEQGLASLLRGDGQSHRCVAHVHGGTSVRLDVGDQLEVHRAANRWLREGVAERSSAPRQRVEPKPPIAGRPPTRSMAERRRPEGLDEGLRHRILRSGLGEHGHVACVNTANGAPCRGFLFACLHCGSIGCSNEDCSELGFERQCQHCGYEAGTDRIRRGALELRAWLDLERRVASQKPPEGDA